MSKRRRRMRIPFGAAGRSGPSPSAEDVALSAYTTGDIDNDIDNGPLPPDIDDDDDDDDGGAGVREPRRPSPTAPAMSAEADPDPAVFLEIDGQRRPAG